MPEWKLYSAGGVHTNVWLLKLLTSYFPPFVEICVQVLRMFTLSVYLLFYKQNGAHQHSLYFFHSNWVVVHHKFDRIVYLYYSLLLK